MRPNKQSSKNAMIVNEESTLVPGEPNISIKVYINLNSFMTEAVIIYKPVHSVDWFLYDNGLRHERVKRLLIITFNITAIRIQRSKRSRRVKFSLDGIRSLSINRTSASLENHRDHFRVQVNS